MGKVGVLTKTRMAPEMISSVRRNGRLMKNRLMYGIKTPTCKNTTQPPKL